PEPIGRTNVNPSMVGGSEPNGGEVFLIMIRSFHIEGVSILRDGMDGGSRRGYGESAFTLWNTRWDRMRIDGRRFDTLE
ncbi:MAG: hypothetical protein UHI54_05615, partial [Bifidobacterium merycicum]|uniref:hypothetical protein n=1 Tax=Bifidobacterium merycicum TaxID=78345 RepID=UPI002E77F925